MHALFVTVHETHVSCENRFSDFTEGSGNKQKLSVVIVAIVKPTPEVRCMTSSDWSSLFIPPYIGMLLFKLGTRHSYSCRHKSGLGQNNRQITICVWPSQSPVIRMIRVRFAVAGLGPLRQVANILTFGYNVLIYWGYTLWHCVYYGDGPVIWCESKHGCIRGNLKLILQSNQPIEWGLENWNNKTAPVHCSKTHFTVWRKLSWPWHIRHIKKTAFIAGINQVPKRH